MRQDKKSHATLSKSSKERRQKFLRRLKFYSSAAGLGAFACASPAQGAITLFDPPDVTITNNISGVSQFIDINPDGGAPEFQIMAPGVSNQIRIDTAFDSGPAGDEKPSHTNGSNLLSLFGNPGSVAPADPNPGYYTESVPGGFSISGATLSPSFYVGLTSRIVNAPSYSYNTNLTGSGRYIGLEWDFDGTTDVRYGWARVDVNPPFFTVPPGQTSATLYDYAFEMTPNTPILAGATPEPSTLALLAVGGGGLALARRRRRRACKA